MILSMGKKIVHVWEKLEIILEAQNEYENPYVDVDVWVDLEGPNFNKRVFGFWDGDNIFKIRILATTPGIWTWKSGSNQNDRGLNGHTGEFEATEWTEKEKTENSCRRGMVLASKNGHTLEYADGTPFFLVGDTWWSTPTFRYKWYDDEVERPIGPEMGFKDMVKYRKRQGFNSIALIASFPAWANDGFPARIVLDDKEQTVIRDAWKQVGTESAADMHNEGGRPFLFPGKIPGYEDVFPDVNRINPEYFQHMDKKIDYLNLHGFVPFIEVARRDISQAWKKFYDWPESYARYIQYVFSRYYANICILSPIHFDWDQNSITAKEYNEPINLFINKYGFPPFGNLISTNAHYSNYRNFGGPDECKWLSLYQIGNGPRVHSQYWYLTEIFDMEEPKPALNGEPYYHGDPIGWPKGKQPANIEEEELYCRSAMYGSVLSGGLAGHIYGAMGLWQGSIEEEASPKMWESLTWESANQMRHLKSFIMSEGERYKELIPNTGYITPSQMGDPDGYKGWVYCAGTRKKDFFLIYFEKESPDVIFRGAIPGGTYKGFWFNPRNGEWTEIKKPIISDASTGRVRLPSVPTNNDWGLKLILA